MKNKLLPLSPLVILILFELFFMPRLIFAEDAQPQSGGPGEKMFDKGSRKAEQFDIEKLYKELNIRDEQKEKLKIEKNQHRKRMKTLQDKLHSLRSELMTELDKSLSDKAKIDSKSGEMKKIMSDMVDERLKSALKIKEILTPEQHNKFVEKRKKFFKEMHNKHQEVGSY